MSNIIIPESHKATHTPAPRAAGVESQLVDSPSITANEMVLARTVAEKLNKCYPGHLWATSIDGGRLIVKNLYLSGEWGFVIRLPDIYSISSLEHDVMRAGGELLERYRQRRGAMSIGDIADLPTDFAGRHKPEL
jgi:hypothetical protein